MGFKSKLLLSLALLVVVPLMADAYVWNVGDSVGWSAQAGYNYTQWAMKKFFIPTDSLQFIYDPITTSVMEVSSEGYNSCFPAYVFAVYNTGNDTIALKRAGHRYFITGNSDDCNKGLRVHIAVTDNPYIVFWRNGPTYGPDGYAINIPEPKTNCTGTAAGGAPASAPTMSPTSPKPKDKRSAAPAPAPAHPKTSKGGSAAPSSPTMSPTSPDAGSAPASAPAMSPTSPAASPTPTRSHTTHKPKEDRPASPTPTRSHTTHKPKDEKPKDEDSSADPTPTWSFTFHPKPKVEPSSPTMSSPTSPEEGCAPDSAPTMSPTSTEAGSAPATSPIVPPTKSSASKFSSGNSFLIVALLVPLGLFY